MSTDVDDDLSEDAMPIIDIMEMLADGQLMEIVSNNQVEFY